MTRASRVFGVALVGLVVPACAGSAVQSGASQVPVTPQSLYPLEAGSAWSYDIDSGDGATTLAVTRVEERLGPIAKVRTGTGPVVQYEVRDEGIVRIKDRVWLIRAPIRQGASWTGRAGRRVTISDVGRTEETTAGTFTNCVEIIEDGGSTGVDVRTVYCPRVGPVLVHSAMKSNVRDRELAVEARLRGYRLGAEPRSPDQE